jgi:anaerobic glycerol-3-phosphate dehydrogenase
VHPIPFWSGQKGEKLVDTPQERAYRSAYRKVEALQIELARHVYSIQRRQDAERKLQEAMAELDRTRKDVIKLRNRMRQAA